MTLFSEQQYQKLLANGQDPDKDHAPVARIYLPLTNCQWLISEIDPNEPYLAFGLCDLGMGFPELGYVSIDEILSVKRLSFGVTNDEEFVGTYPMSVYACAARLNSEITTEEQYLQQCSTKLKRPKLQP